MKKYSTTWTEEITFVLDKGDVDLDVDVYPLIVEHFAARYEIGTNKADKILEDNPTLLGDYYDWFEEEIIDEAKFVYKDDAIALWEEWELEEWELIASDNLRRL